MAKSDLAETAASSTCGSSPRSAAAASSSAPPASISIAVASCGDAGSGAWREYTEPSDHARQPKASMRAPAWSTCSPPSTCSGPTSSSRPASPSASPVTTVRVGRRPPGRAQSRSTIHSGTMATSSAVTPEGTRCSAHTTAPLPPSSMQAPTTAAARQWTGAGRAAPRQRSQA